MGAKPKGQPHQPKRDLAALPTQSPQKGKTLVSPRSNRANLREGPALARVPAHTVHTQLPRATAGPPRDPIASLCPLPGQEEEDEIQLPRAAHLPEMATWELPRLHKAKTHTLPLSLSKVSSPYLGMLPALGITFSFCSLEILYQQFPSLKFKKKKKKKGQELCPAASEAIVPANDRDTRCHS